MYNVVVACNYSLKITKNNDMVLYVPVPVVPWYHGTHVYEQM